MELLYVHEHLTCKNYVSDFEVGFDYREVSKGEKIAPSNKYFNHILFILEGEVMMSCNEFRNHLCKAGEMVFIPQDSDSQGEVVADSKHLILSFDNQFTLCEQLSLESLQAYSKQIPVFHKMEIYAPLQSVLESVLFYLNNKIQCKHLHTIKQKEVFLIFRVFYEKEQMSAFLAPMLNKNINFKAFVLQHYQEVKTVEELAAMCNISTRSFNRKFNEFFGDSPYSWILKQKSFHIKSRLADARIPFRQIIKEFGFSSPAHFTTYCKKQFEESPSKLRKQLISDNY